MTIQEAKTEVKNGAGIEYTHSEGNLRKLNEIFGNTVFVGVNPVYARTSLGNPFGSNYKTSFPHIKTWIPIESVVEDVREEVDIEHLSELEVERQGWGKFEGTSEQVGIKNAYKCGFNTALLVSKSLVPPQTKIEEVKTDWISVGELPAIDKWVLLFNGHWVGVGKYHPDEDRDSNPEWQDETSEYINPIPTHWMPLPQPPKQ